jgi:hypothetical protein
MIPSNSGYDERAEGGGGVVDNAKHKVPVQRPHRGDVVPDAVRAPEVAVLGEGKTHNDQRVPRGW